MRTIVPVALVALMSATAFADVTGVYDVKYEEVSTNCTSPLRYPPGKLTIKVIGNSLTVDIDRTPLMGGIPSKTDKISAKSKSGTTMVDGMNGVFSVAGKVTPEGLLHLVMVGEYSAGGKPLCTQSWNVNGPRTDTVKPKKTQKTQKPAPAKPVMHDLVTLTRF
ncbi:MAG: hypothetical protein H0V17_23190 [Deltaproteobacteria bacterium]|nr:hypothetical protein [Deltaproteobacteria bacterium]